MNHYSDVCQILKSYRAFISDDSRLVGYRDIFVVTKRNIEFVNLAISVQVKILIVESSIAENVKSMVAQNSQSTSQSVSVLANVDRTDEVLKTVLTESDVANLKKNEVGVISVDDLEENLHKILQQYYSPTVKNIMCVTGTNGKTSTAMFVRQFLTLLQKNVASITTIGVSINDESELIFNTGLTAPSICDMHRILHTMSSKFNAEYAVFEASSHGIDQGRMLGLDIKVAGFTNLSQDHLDYHGTMENYFATKSRLFSEYLADGGVAVVNADAEEFDHLNNICKKRGIKVIGYGFKGGELKLINFTSNFNGQAFNVEYEGETYASTTSIVGNFQIHNILCAIGMLSAFGISPKVTIPLISQLQAPAGRLQKIMHDNKFANIFVDYAHTPDALERALMSLKNHRQGKTIVVFGCGGERDKSKRGIMGEIAALNADVVIVTDDNPRGEDPSEIRKDIISGIKRLREREMEDLMGKGTMSVLSAMQAEKSKLIEVTSNRKEAITQSVNMCGPDDVVLIAGKGHENYQIIDSQRIPFSDCDVAIEACLKKEANSGNQ